MERSGAKTKTTQFATLTYARRLTLGALSLSFPDAPSTERD